jgi:diacylglycerol kinase
MIEPSRLRQSFSHALRGVRVVFETEQSFRIQCLVAALTVLAAALLGVSRSEWIVLLLLVGAVLTLEMINSVFERIVDAFRPRIHPVVHDIKDIMAATVLLVSAAAAVVGLSIFLPRLATLF